MLKEIREKEKLQDLKDLASVASRSLIREAENLQDLKDLASAKREQEESSFAKTDYNSFLCNIETPLSRTWQIRKECGFDIPLPAAKFSGGVLLFSNG